MPDSPPISEKWLDVDGQRVHYLAAGTAGPPVVLLHGGGLDSARLTYGPTLPELAREHRVIAPDWPGFGESPAPSERWDLARYEEFLGKLLDRLGLERASLVGLSLGGGLALGFALHHPERVERLVLVDSYGLGSDVPGGIAGYALVHLPFVNALTWRLLGRSRYLVRKSLEAIFANPRAVDDGLVEEAFHLARRPGAGRAWQAIQEREVGLRGLRTSYLDQLSRLSVPTLILHGSSDRAVPVAWAQRAHERIAVSSLVVVPEAGHWLPREKPEEFVKAAREFLTDDDIFERT
ncbi:MAG TPA: alpha/beta fold hydrolase [Chloroflexota bacterium]|nr:alpha/beta fold hydrolase [Chloroflexota bacterium]